MKYVLDSSVGFKWFLIEDQTDKARLLRDDYRAHSLNWSLRMFSRLKLFTLSHGPRGPTGSRLKRDLGSWPIFFRFFRPASVLAFASSRLPDFLPNPHRRL